MNTNLVYDVVIVGAGAAGLMCAATAAKRGKSVLVLDKAKKAAEKIRISGGGRCNFTNRFVKAENYLSENPHFCKSALAGYTADDFIRWVEDSGITFHEREHGQLFCDVSAQAVIDMLLSACAEVGVQLWLETEVLSLSHEDAYHLFVSKQGEALNIQASALVVATGALSIPKMGATGWGHNIAKQFGLRIVTPRPGLVPFTFSGREKEDFLALAGIAIPVSVSIADKKRSPIFKEAMLFTHRGLSGPAILQISSYWTPGDSLLVDVLPQINAALFLSEKKLEQPLAQVSTVLSSILPKRLVALFAESLPLQQKMQSLSDKDMDVIANFLHAWRIKPGSTECYRTAEVTVGGVDTRDLDSKTMEAKSQQGLYFIGEVVDVTGHLGGFNFQWAWSSGFAAGNNVV
ncbi:MAG: hypothetical protein AUK35_09600 [Zetaproteobacteria bacterium CG2_30_46_52]|nr:MAG: hypothetical protein AUK35_09600 [Zetaproteobacteria bacterium CG2_30_46_52]